MLNPSNDLCKKKKKIYIYIEEEEEDIKSDENLYIKKEESSNVFIFVSYNVYSFYF